MLVPFLPKDRHLAAFLAERLRRDTDVLEHLVYANTEHNSISATAMINNFLDKEEERRAGSQARKQDERRRKRRRSRTRSLEPRRLRTRSLEQKCCCHRR